MYPTKLRGKQSMTSFPCALAEMSIMGSTNKPFYDKSITSVIDNICYSNQYTQSGQEDVFKYLTYFFFENCKNLNQIGVLKYILHVLKISNILHEYLRYDEESKQKRLKYKRFSQIFRTQKLCQSSLFKRSVGKKGKDIQLTCS